MARGKRSELGSSDGWCVHLEGLLSVCNSYAEVARLLDLPASTVRSAAVRCGLKSKLGERRVTDAMILQAANRLQTFSCVVLARELGVSKQTIARRVKRILGRFYLNKKFRTPGQRWLMYSTDQLYSPEERRRRRALSREYKALWKTIRRSYRVR